MNHGLILNPVEDDHYILGASPIERVIIMPDGHGWGAYKPTPEYQNKNGLETMNCSNYGTHNALETLAKFKGFDDFPKDCSERYSGCLTGTTQDGNDPHKVIEIIRTEIGVIPEVNLPFNEDIKTWEDYYTQQSAKWLLSFGKRILSYVKIRHEWVFAWGSAITVKEKIAKLKEALQYGTVCVSVMAWRHTRDDLYYKNVAEQDNHWVQLLDYKEGEWWLIFDHYDAVEKKLKWEYDFNASKVYYMDRISTNLRITFWDRIWFSLQKNGILGLWKS
jgi:hypothetical protein